MVRDRLISLWDLCALHVVNGLLLCVDRHHEPGKMAGDKRESEGKRVRTVEHCSSELGARNTCRINSERISLSF